MASKYKVSAKTAKAAGGSKTRQKSASRNSAKPAKLSVAKTYKLYINGKFPRTESGRYFALKKKGDVVANICQASRKDLREAVVAGRAAQKSWAASSAYLKGQILYRAAEMLEGRRAQFVSELVAQGLPEPKAQSELDQAIDCLVHYAGWADKYQQIFSTVNPVASSHFNFSVPEPTGVVAVIAPQRSGLIGLVAAIAQAIVGGNTVIALASQSLPLCAISFAEVLHSSDVPAGVVNILTGYVDELGEHLASHMDINAIVYTGNSKTLLQELETLAANNVKRVIARSKIETTGPYTIRETQEIKTTWHPIGG